MPSCVKISSPVGGTQQLNTKLNELTGGTGLSWVKASDKAGSFPHIMQVIGLPDVDDRTRLELMGFVFLMFLESAKFDMDYHLPLGTAYRCADSLEQAKRLLGYCRTLGICRDVTEGKVPAIALIEDPDFLNLQSREDKERRNRQRNDTRDPRLEVPVRQRDGDNCRWCNVRVHWKGPKTPRDGTLDHLRPGHPGTVETLVVSCRSCNSARKDNPQWDETYELYPEPKMPRYGSATARFLSEHNIPTVPNIGPDRQPNTNRSRSGDAPDDESVESTPSRIRKHVTSSSVAPSVSREVTDTDTSIVTPTLDDSRERLRSAGQPDGSTRRSPGRPGECQAEQFPVRKSDPGVAKKSTHTGALGVPTLRPSKSQSISPRQVSTCRDGTGRDSTGLPGTGLTGTARLGVGSALPGTGLRRVGSGDGSAGSSSGEAVSRRKRGRRHRGR